MTGQAGAEGVAPGWQSISWHVTVSSDGSVGDVERVLAHAARLSPMLDVVHPRCTRRRTFSLRGA
jgi:hypothetical protein